MMQSLLRYLAANDLGLPEVPADTPRLQIIANIAFLAVGVLSVIFVIIGGYQYILSSGDPQQTARAKETILYAIIGLVIAVSAATIVNFVIVRLFP